MADIKKLEKLSCLHLSEEVKEKVANSIDGVMNMIQEIEGLDMPVLKSDTYKKTELTIDAKERLYSREDAVQGLHLEETMFLAPKVIKK